jgi:hypothetical protein
MAERMPLPLDLQRVTIDTRDLDDTTPERTAQLSMLMLRLGSLLGHFPTARAHIEIWNDLVEDNLHLHVEIVIPNEELEA